MQNSLPTKPTTKATTARRRRKVVNSRTSKRHTTSRRKSRRSKKTSKRDAVSTRRSLQREKEKEIQKVLEGLNTGDGNRSELIKELRNLAISKHGLVHDTIRKTAWPVLLGFQSDSCSMDIETVTKELGIVAALETRKKGIEPEDPDEAARVERILQIRRDVDRSLFQLDRCQKWSPEERAIHQSQLEVVINFVLDRHESLHYYQGLHDVASVFLLIVGPDLALPLTERFCLWFLQEHQRSSFGTTISVLKLLLPLLRKADAEVFEYLVCSRVEPYFALPWVLTGFAHHFRSMTAQARVYDSLLALHPLFPLYLTTAAVTQRIFRKGLLQQDCDMASVHLYLQGLPQPAVLPRGEGEVSLDDIIESAVELLQRVPPGELLRFAKSQGKKIARDDRFQMDSSEEVVALVEADVPPSSGKWVAGCERKARVLSRWEKLRMRQVPGSPLTNRTLMAVVAVAVATGVALIINSLSTSSER